MNQTTNGNPGLGSMAAWRDRKVVSRDGAELGTLDSLLYEFTSEEPLWLVAEGGLLKSRFVLPVRGAALAGGSVRVPFDKATVEGEPMIDVGASIDDMGEYELLCRYFSEPWNPDADLRILGKTDAIPGQERVETPSSPDSESRI